MAALVAHLTAPQVSALCAVVKLEILQELTFERIAFDARLAVTNGLPDVPLENFRVDVDIRDMDGNPADDLFFVRISSMDKISGVDGSGVVAPGVKAEVHWLIIPTSGAGGTLPEGKKYRVGAMVSFTTNGLEQLTPVLPDTITVKPQPELFLDYFMPPQVEGDNPFTPQVEAAIPFPLGVRVKNDGFGPANKLQITSGQPKIVENKQGLLIDFKLLGSQVNDQPVSPSLNAQFGNILSKKCGTGHWDMISTLSGYFIEFKAEFSHAEELGGALTSLIKQVDAHYLVHEVMVDMPGRDSIRDFLSAPVPPYDEIFDRPEDWSPTPDKIYESDCVETPVTVMAATTTGAPTAGNPAAQLDITATPPIGWIYAKVVDPATGNVKPVSVVRSDGKKLNANNWWVTNRYDRKFNLRHYEFHLVDNDSTGQYTIMYEPPAEDHDPPTSRLVINDPRHGSDPVYVTADTQFVILGEDAVSGVAALNVKIDGEDYRPALPFKISPPVYTYGAHAITWYAQDRAGNSETPHVATVFVDNSAPVIDTLTALPSAFIPLAPPDSPEPDSAILHYLINDDVSDLAVTVEIAQGVGDFSTLTRVRTIQTTVLKGIAGQVVWDGRNDGGSVVPAGKYTARLTVDDYLGHSSSATVELEVKELLAPAEPDSTSTAEQKYPALYGSRLTWQDYGSGNWDIMLYDIATATLTNLTSGNPAAQERPALDARYTVWQDRRSGNWDIYIHDSQTSTVTPLVEEVHDQQKPAVAAPWVVWQDNRDGNWDVYAYNMTTQELRPLTSDTRDQINPAIYGNMVAWEDYRHGLGEIYLYNLDTKVETRITDSVYNQTSPTINDRFIVWVDGRDGNQELYAYDLVKAKEVRLTYTHSDEVQPRLYGNHAVYAEFSAGINDPNLGIYNLLTRQSFNLSADPHRQEYPALFSSRVAWQDDRSGKWRVLYSDVDLTLKQREAALVPGFNIVPVNGVLATSYVNIFPLITAWNSGIAVSSAQDLDAATMLMRQAIYSGAPSGTDFALRENTALFVQTGAKGVVNIGTAGACEPLNLSQGVNLMSYGCLPTGFKASTFINSVGMTNVAGIARFDPDLGRWQALAVEGGALAGEDFDLSSEAGYIVYMSSPVSNWEP